MAGQHPDALVAEAKKQPGGWVYELRSDADADGEVPPSAIRGAWKVSDDGEIIGDFIPNPNYEPLTSGPPRLS